MNTLKYGSSGSEVKALQTALNRAGLQVTVDGIFGAQTTTAVKKFQLANGLTVDGIVGPATWDKLRGLDYERIGRLLETVLNVLDDCPEYHELEDLLNV